MYFRIPYQIGTAHGEAGFLHIEAHTDAMGHSLITGTLGARVVEKRIRDVLGDIAQDIEKAQAKGAMIE